MSHLTDPPSTEIDAQRRAGIFFWQEKERVKSFPHHLPLLSRQPDVKLDQLLMKSQPWYYGIVASLEYKILLLE